jgi:hypothetical protein
MLGVRPRARTAKHARGFGNSRCTSTSGRTLPPFHVPSPTHRSSRPSRYPKLTDILRTLTSSQSWQHRWRAPPIYSPPVGAGQSNLLHKIQKELHEDRDGISKRMLTPVGRWKLTRTYCLPLTTVVCAAASVRSSALVDSRAQTAVVQDTNAFTMEQRGCLSRKSQSKRVCFCSKRN